MKQGDIWLINLDPTVGSEMKKIRPAIVVNDDSLGKLPLKIITPLTDWKSHYADAEWMVKIDPDKLNGLTKESATDCFQIRSVSKDRFIKKIGEINSVQLLSIQISLANVLSIETT